MSIPTYYIEEVEPQEQESYLILYEYYNLDVLWF